MLQVSGAKPAQYWTRLAPEPMCGRGTPCLSREKDSLEVLGNATVVQVFSNREKKKKQKNQKKTQPKPTT